MLSMVVASLLPWVTSPRVGIGWLAMLSTLIGLVALRNPDIGPAIAVLLGAIFMGLGFFAYIASMASRELSQASAELVRVNSELRATQRLLTENTRIAERVRIARELHDLVGHHLTALTLNLEVATHLIEGRALEHVEQARSIARLLLADVREVVSEMRSNDGVDLAQAVRMLTEGVPRPRIHLDIPDDFRVTDPQRAQVLLRCAQEAITNAVRHSGAQNLWLSLRSEHGELDLAVRDDGAGAEHDSMGNGLRGMRERLRQLGGDLDLETTAGQGFALRAHLPLERAA
jgi:signal transduction histidine kinase